MAIDIVTKEDLQIFRDELIKEIKLLVNPNTQIKKWLKSPEVRKLLGISPGTLLKYQFYLIFCKPSQLH